MKLFLPAIVLTSSLIPIFFFQIYPIHGRYKFFVVCQFTQGINTFAVLGDAF